jgi:hypothetical protein
MTTCTLACSDFNNQIVLAYWWLRKNDSTTCLEVGKVALKINGDEVLSDESVLKSNGDKALNHDFS